MGFFTIWFIKEVYKVGDKWSDSGYILKTEAIWPPDSMEMEYDQKKKQGWLLDFSLINYKDETAIKSQRSEDLFVFIWWRGKAEVQD